MITIKAICKILSPQALQYFFLMLTFHSMHWSYRKQGGKGFGQKESSPAVVATKPSEVKSLSRRFELEPHDNDEWLAWLEGLKTTANTQAQNLYVQVQLDGSVRGSGEGQPPWERFCNEIPKLDSMRTRFTDGLRR